MEKIKQDISDNTEKESFINTVSENIEANTAYKQWVTYFKNTQGNIFDTLDYENSKKYSFAISVYYDYIVSSLINQIENLYNFTVINKSSTYNNEELSFCIKNAYPDDIQENQLFSDLTKEDIAELTPDSVRKIQKLIIPKELRKFLGEFHTPFSTSKLLLEQLSETTIQEDSFLDPGSGSGTFISACILKKRNYISDITLNEILNSVYAIDLNPISVKTTKLSYLLSVLPLIDNTTVNTIELPVFLKDAVELTHSGQLVYNNSVFELSVDTLIGNPPYTTWSKLPEYLKEEWKETYVEELQLDVKDGVDKKLGHSNDDISVPFVWVCIDKYLTENGRAVFIMKRDMMKSTSGELFRTMQVGNSSLSLNWILDFNKIQLFGSEVQVDVAGYCIEKNNTTDFPIDCLSFTKSDTVKTDTLQKFLQSTEKSEKQLTTLHKNEQSSILVDKKISQNLIGTCEYNIRHGVKGDKKEVFKLDDDSFNSIENERVYPYITSRHIVKFGLFEEPDKYLLPIDKSNQMNSNELQQNLPKTYNYLHSNKNKLQSRSSTWLKKGEFYNVFGVGDYTWSKYKVCWCRLGFKPNFAVFSTYQDPELGEKQVIPGDHFMYIPIDNKQEAYYIAGLLNSEVYQKAIESITSKGKSSLTKSVIDKLKIPTYKNSTIQKKIAQKSIQCSDIVEQNVQNMSKRSYNSQTFEDLTQKKSELNSLVNQFITTFEK